MKEFHQTIIKNEVKDATEEEAKACPESVVKLGTGDEIKTKSLMACFMGETTVNGEPIEVPEGYEQEDGMGVLIAGPWTLQQLMKAGAAIRGEIQRTIRDLGPEGKSELQRMLFEELLGMKE